MPKLPAPPLPEALKPAPAAPGRGQRQGRRRSSTPAEAGHHRRRLGRRAHLAVAAAARWLMFRKVPKGTNWFYTLGSATMFAFLIQAVTGVFLAMYYDPSPTRGLRVDPLHHQRRLPRRVRARHAQVGLVGDGDPDLPAHGADVLLRRLQVPARAQLGHRRRAADPHDGDGAHRLPAAVRPALLLGDDRRRQHQRHRPARRARTSATSCAAGPSSARRRCRASTRSTCCSCPARSPR